MGINEEKYVTLNTEPAASPSNLGMSQRPVPQSSHVYEFDRWLVRKLLEIAGNPPFAMRLWDGSVIEAQRGAPFQMTFHDRRALLWVLLNPELRFGDLYSFGRIEVSGDLVDFIGYCYRGLRFAAKHGGVMRLARWLNKRPHRNTLRASRYNISHHYDIGNEFYALWLDKPAMQYTCGYYPDPDMSLEDAQQAKLHHVCRKLLLKPGDTVVEAGCGWGGLARFMAKHYGVTVKAYNISHEQVRFARQRAQEEGLADRVEYIEDDYRNIRGSFDVFVSVGMLEHVGVSNYQELGEVIQRCLKPDGRGLIHTIGRRRPGMMNAWIERRIFPGARPPSLAEMTEIFEPHEFAVQDVENLRLHYAKTLRHWLQRFDQNVETIRNSYDEVFVRAWRLYLAGSIAAFSKNELQLYQVMFTGPDNHQLPWSRKHLYQ
jgi:cyclopropane-fatty-acyl-phospholipid synthase